ncbi:unnamed protein product [Closterium sp. NIES-53]
MRLKSASFNGRDSFRELTARQRVAGHVTGHVTGHAAGHAGAPPGFAAGGETCEPCSGDESMATMAIISECTPWDDAAARAAAATNAASNAASAAAAAAAVVADSAAVPATCTDAVYIAAGKPEQREDDPIASNSNSEAASIADHGSIRVSNASDPNPPTLNPAAATTLRVSPAKPLRTPPAAAATAAAAAAPTLRNPNPTDPMSAVTPVTPLKSHSPIVTGDYADRCSPMHTESCGNGSILMPEPSADSPSSALKPSSSASPSASASASACAPAPAPPARNGLVLPGRASLDTLQASPAPPLALANPRRVFARRSASSGENPPGLSLINRRTAAAGSGRGLASRREVPGLNRPGRGPGGFKLDMGALQRSRGERDFAREAQEAQARRDKFAFFEKDCSRVLEHVYVGSDFVARSREVLKEAGITHVLNCVGFVCPEYFPEEINYKTLWLQDNTGEDLVCVLYDVFDYIEAVRAARGRVFIHCCQGISRSTSLVIAYLMWREGIPFGDAFKRVKALRAVANPNMGFACQLLQWQTRILPASALDPPPTPQPTARPPAAPDASDASAAVATCGAGGAAEAEAAAAASGGKLLAARATGGGDDTAGQGAAAAAAAALHVPQQPAQPSVAEPALTSGAAMESGAAEASGAAGSCHMYRMAPHSPYDALHLVPKITALSRHSLDPRGAFIVQVSFESTQK